MSKIKELKEKRAKLIVQAQEISQADGYGSDKDQQATFNKMMDEAKALQKQIADMQASANIALELEKGEEFNAGKQGGFDHSRQAHNNAEEYKNSFDKFMRFGRASLSHDEQQVLQKGFSKMNDPQNAQEIATPSKGGYTVPDEFMSIVEMAEKEYNAMRLAGCRVLTTTNGRVLPMPTANTTATKGRRMGSEGTKASQTDIVFGEVSVKAHTYSSDIILVSNELLQDVGVNLEEIIGVEAGERIGRITNEEFTVTGTGDAPTGCLTAAAAGNTAAAVDEITFKEITDLEFSVNSAYRKKKSAGFMMNDTILRDIVQMTDGQGRPLWLPSMREGDPDTIRGYRYTINDDMPDAAAGTTPLMFGAFEKYMIRDVAGGQLRRLEERYADDNQTAFILFKRHDGQLIDAGTNPIKKLTMAAS